MPLLASPRPGRLTAIRMTALALAASACASRVQPPPSTRTVTAADTMHGEVVADPYKWLEDQSSADVRSWIAAQAAYADSIVGSTPQRAELQKRFRELMDVPNAGAPRKAGDWEYFTLRKKGDEVAAIYRRKPPATPTPVDPQGTYEKVLDPIALRADGTTSIEIQGFSPDGKLLLYSIRDGGPDEVSVHVRDLIKGSDLPDSLPWALYASISFDENAKGMYYVHRSRTVGPRFKHHVFGTDVATDAVLFGDGYAPTAFLNVSLLEGGKRRLYTVGHGWARNDVFLQDVAKGGAITTIAKDLPAHFSPQFVDGTLWMRTDLDAPKGRLATVDLAKPEPANWHTVIPEGSDVLDGFTTIDGKLYVTFIHDVANQIKVYTKDGKPAGDVAVPPMSSANIRGNGKGKALLTINGFAQPTITYSVDLATGAREVWEKNETPFDTTGVEVQQVWYPTMDGQRNPMYVMYKRGTKRDGSAPAMLTGYGGFSLSLLPRFDPRAAVWIEHGGVFAQATLRGGNEYGESFHRGGMLANKPNVFNDFTSAAQALVDSGFTKPERLAIRGTSNGGLLMGAAVTRRPDLFRVAYIGNPDLDIQRFPWFNTANNAPALLEYGDASKPDEYKVIASFSPYQNVKANTKYPAMFIATGQLDTRVPPWAARKFAARVQASTTSGLPVILYNDMRQGHAGGRGVSGNVDLAAKDLDFMLRMVGSPPR
ncbi:MAG: prolyl oligopeptidase family serine peptidase [Gemmatimonadaceae bacterium]